MSENTLGCKSMTQDDFLEMIENNPILKEKLEEIGLDQSDDGLTIPLDYSDLLTDKEKKRLKKMYKKFGFKKKDGVYSWFIKFHGLKVGYYVCETDVICDNCYKGLLEYREEKKEKEAKKAKKKKK